MYDVYGLINPRTGVVFYVGLSLDARGRTIASAITTARRRLTPRASDSPLRE
jgi:hypothetical protein